MKAALIVGLGSFIGGSLRYLSVVDRAETRIPIPCWYPIRKCRWVVLDRFGDPGLERIAWNGEPLVPLFLTAGVMGGFTTFSAYSLQTLKLAQGPMGHGTFKRPGEYSLLPIVCFRRLEARSAIVLELLRCLGALDDFVS